MVQSGRRKAVGYLVGKSRKKTNQTAIKLSERRPIPLCVSHSSCISLVPVKPIAMLKSMVKHKSSDDDNDQHPILAGKAQCAMKGDLCVKEAGKMKWSHPCRYAKMKKQKTCNSVLCRKWKEEKRVLGANQDDTLRALGASPWLASWQKVYNARRNSCRILLLLGCRHRKYPDARGV